MVVAVAEVVLVAKDPGVVVHVDRPFFAGMVYIVCHFALSCDL